MGAGFTLVFVKLAPFQYGRGLSEWPLQLESWPSPRSVARYDLQGSFESAMLHFASQRGGSIQHDGRLAQHRFSFRFSRTSFLQTKYCPMKTTPHPFLTSACAAATLLLLCAASLSAAPGLRREIWDNLEGPAEVQLSDRPSFFGPPLTLTTSEAFYGPPATADILANALSPNIYGGSYGARLRGYLTAPATGDYIFSEGGPDTVAVYLSTDENPTGKRMILAHSSLAAG